MLVICDKPVFSFNCTISTLLAKSSSTLPTARRNFCTSKRQPSGVSRCLPCRVWPSSLSRIWARERCMCKFPSFEVHSCWTAVGANRTLCNESERKSLASFVWQQKLSKLCYVAQRATKLNVLSGLELVNKSEFVCKKGRMCDVGRSTLCVCVCVCVCLWRGVQADV